MINLTTFPNELFTSKQVRDIDHSAIHTHGIEGYQLMSKAAAFTFKVLRETYPHTNNLIVYCGSGNNAGDGYIVAALAQQASIKTKVVSVAPREKLKGDALQAYNYAKSAHVEMQDFDKEQHLTENADSTSVIIDALLGTGLNTEVSGVYLDAITAINHSSYPAIAIDIPSGLCANTGRVMGAAVNAALTTSYIGLKIGLFTGSGRTFSGEILFDSLDVPKSIISEQKPCAHLLKLEELLETFPQRPHDAHKGHHGHTLIIGGNTGYGGAAVLSAEATLRSGSGLTSVITHESHCSAILSRLPEVMVLGHRNYQAVSQLISQADTIVIGPGLGQDAWAQRMLQAVLAQQKKTVIDADALNLISKNARWQELLIKNGQNTVITPHPGEAARLLNVDNKTVQKDRLQSLHQLTERFNCHVLLKGSGSLVSTPNKVVGLCAYGNPGMASGGMGDVLSGIIGALLSQSLTPEKALSLGVALHSSAADIAASEKGERGLAASDLIPIVRSLMN